MRLSETFYSTRKDDDDESSSKASKNLLLKRDDDDETGSKANEPMTLSQEIKINETFKRFDGKVEVELKAIKEAETDPIGYQ